MSSAVPVPLVLTRSWSCAPLCPPVSPSGVVCGRLADRPATPLLSTVASVLSSVTLRCNSPLRQCVRARSAGEGQPLFTGVRIARNTSGNSPCTARGRAYCVRCPSRPLHGRTLHGRHSSTGRGLGAGWTAGRMDGWTLLGGVGRPQLAGLTVSSDSHGPSGDGHGRSSDSNGEDCMDSWSRDDVHDRRIIEGVRFCGSRVRSSNTAILQSCDRASNPAILQAAY